MFSKLRFSFLVLLCVFLSSCASNSHTASFKQNSAMMVSNPVDGTKLYYDLVVNKHDYEKASDLYSVDYLKKQYGEKLSDKELNQKKLEELTNTWSKYSNRQNVVGNFGILFSNQKENEATIGCYVDIQWNSGLNWNNFYKIVHWKKENNHWYISYFEPNSSKYLKENGFVSAKILSKDPNTYGDCTVRLYNTSDKNIETEGLSLKLVGFDNSNNKVFESDYLDFYKKLTPGTYEDDSIDINTEKHIDRMEIEWE